jgi:hypothetical protein
MLRHLTLCAIGMAAWPALSAEKAIWACRTEHANAEPIIHLVEWGQQSYVKFAHMRFGAAFTREGESQAWYWDNSGDGYYRYGFVLGPDDKAWLHDFSDTGEAGLSTPVDYLVCRSTS